MGQNSITMFTNDSGVAGGPIAYVQDAFPDVSDTPSTNSGWSSTVSSNPLNNLYGNDDFPRFGPKTLWIKDLVLEPNRQLWVNGEPTYRIIWSEPWPSAQGYVFGNVSLKRNQNQTFVQVRSVGDGFGVGGVFARCMFLMQGVTNTIATATVAVDGVSNSTVIDTSRIGPSNPNTDPQYNAIVHASANEAYNIHDFRLTANQAGSIMQIAGVIVYSENSTLTIDQFPGITYNNKTQSRTTANTTLPLPSFSASLGGRSTIWKTANAGYSMSTIGVSTITSIAQGNIATNILNITAGTGASFSAGYGIITYSSAGASSYVGVIQSISTDALTVFPTLPFGISNTIYRYFQSGQSLALNASLNILAYTFGSTEMLKQGFTTTFLDPLQNFAVWSSNTSATLMDGIVNSLVFSGLSGTIGASGFVQCEGYFSAADIEWFGQSFSVLSGTMVVNGLPVYNHNNIGFTGVLRKTVFGEAGPGWNSFAFFPGSSMVNVGIQRINLYQRNRDISASYGILSSFDTLQSFVPRAVNATYVAPGTFKRTFADQLTLKGQSLTRLIGATWPGGIAYACGISAALSFQYYGTHFALFGGSSIGFGASIQLSLDSGANQGSTAMNTVIQGTSLTFHSVSMIVLGGTLFISGVDFFKTYGEMKNIQIFSQPSLTNPSPIKINRNNTFQIYQNNPAGMSLTYFTPYGCIGLKIKLAAGGGGGGGGDSATGGAGGGGGGSGAYIEHYISNPLASYPVGLGANGTGGAVGNPTGTAGNLAGNSFFGISLLLASGGDGGAAGSGVGGGGQGGVGGTAIGGNIINMAGNPGANGTGGVAGVNQGVGGGGGGNPLGTGGLGGAANNAGLAASGMGAGGGGGSAGGNSGTSSGVIIEEIYG